MYLYMYMFCGVYIYIRPNGRLGCPNQNTYRVVVGHGDGKGCLAREIISVDISSFEVTQVGAMSTSSSYPSTSYVANSTGLRAVSLVCVED